MRALYASEAAISLGDFNEEMRRAEDRVYEMLPALASAYEEEILKLGKSAAARFSTALTAAADWVPPSENELTPVGSELAGVSAARAEAYALYTHFLSASFAGLEFGDVFSPDMQALIALRAGAAFDAEMRDVLRDIITDAFDRGLSVPQTANEIRDAFLGLARYRAEMLARTDLNTIANAGSQKAASIVYQDDPVYKTWLTARDGRVRPAHSAAEGQTVPIDQPFNIGGFHAMYPGDPSLPLRLSANCRCTQFYVEGLTAGGDTLGGNMSTSDSTLHVNFNEVDKWTPILVKTQGDGFALVGWTMTGDSASATASSLTADVQITVSEDNAEAEEETAAIPWRGVLALEGIGTGDGRYFAADAWSWRDLPLTLSAQVTNEEGHQGAQVVGRIDRIWKEKGNPEFGEGVTAIMGEGVFDRGEFGQEVARMVRDQTLRGVSVDYSVSEAALRDPETGDFVDPEDAELDLADFLFGSKYEFAALKAEIGMATIVAYPAFEGASLAIAADGRKAVVGWPRIWLIEDATTALTAAAAGMVPLQPPRSWFQNPELSEATALTVTEDGQVFGHIALWGTCHTGLPGCTSPPHSATDYRYFHLGAVEVEDGGFVPCGKITLDTGHASLDKSWEQTRSHYDNTGTVAAHVVAGEDRHGIWVAGALHPELGAEKVRLLRGSTPSGDWRSVNGHGKEMLAVLAVNVPGFPVPRPEARIAITASGEEEVLALVAAGILHPRLPRETQRKVRMLMDEATSLL